MCRDGSACDIGDEVGLSEVIRRLSAQRIKAVSWTCDRGREFSKKSFTEFEGKACQPASRALMHACYD